MEHNKEVQTRYNWKELSVDFTIDHRKKLIRDAERVNDLITFFTGKTKEERQREQEVVHLENARIEALLATEYGPAIEPTNPWWECDC